MILQTARLTLRPWHVTDAERLYQLARDPAVGPSAGWPPHQSVAQSREILRRSLSGRECYAVCARESGLPIGCIELMFGARTDMTERADECELGYWLGRAYWGQGLMVEAARALLERAFVTLGVRAVWCGYYAGNGQSLRVQEKLGFVPHHTCARVPVPQMGETRVGHVRLLTRADWLAQRAHVDGTASENRAMNRF